MPIHPPVVSRGLAKLASYRITGIVKEADGDAADQPFEVAFSNVAHAYMRAKAPTLLDYEVGFQLVDKSEDNAKAIGVFGFKIGSQWLFAPAFFLNGDLKGHELLYMKKQDMFVPLQENWLNYLLNRKPALLGEPVGRNSQQLGVVPPDLSPMTNLPYKRASATREEFLKELDGVLPAFAHLATSASAPVLQKLGQELDLATFLKEASLETIERLLFMCNQMPTVGEAVGRYHGFGTISEAIKAAGERRRNAPPAPRPRVKVARSRSVLDDTPEHPIKTGELKIVTFDVTHQSALPSGLSEEDGEKLMRDTVLITDKRDSQKTTIPYDTQVDKCFVNPTDTGLYEILMKPGIFEKCLVLTKPSGPVRRETFSVVIRLSEPRNWRNIATRNLWAASQHDGMEWSKWFEDLSSAEVSETANTRYVAIGPRGDCTLPFRVRKKLGEEYGGNAYEVDFDSYCPGPTDFPVGNKDYGPRSFSPLDEGYGHGERIHLDGKTGASLRVMRGDVYVPTDFKILAVEPAKHDEDNRKAEHGDGCHPCYPAAGESENPPIMPGSIMDVELQLLGKTAAFRVWNDGLEMEINGGPRMSQLNGLISLVRDHGFTEDVARGIVKRSAAKRKFSCRVLYPDYIKAAADPFLAGQGPDAPAFPPTPYGGESIMGASVPTQLEMEQEVPVSGMQPSLSNRAAYDITQNLSGQERNTLQQAVDTGQKEIFDTSVIGSMLKAVRDDTIVGRYLGKLTSGMDALGRLLFMFYWHGDDFADKYGKADMPELEDSLRNSFESMGSVILFLKQKEISPYPEENDIGVDLGPVAAG